MRKILNYVWTLRLFPLNSKNLKILNSIAYVIRVPIDYFIDVEVEDGINWVFLKIYKLVTHAQSVCPRTNLSILHQTTRLLLFDSYRNLLKYGKKSSKKPNYDRNFTDKKQFKKLFSQFKSKETKNFWWLNCYNVKDKKKLSHS